MFKFIKNLIPVSRKRYKRDTRYYLKDVETMEFFKGLIKEDKETIDLLEAILEGKNREISRLELKNETLSKFLEEERKRNADMFKTLMDSLDKQEGSQVKAVG
ncbi:MAG: hypothetical protein KIB00_17575 [Paeniclostridium sordellii]|nr:hypothetical protein [Paeniclostridium sordellii]